MKKILKIVSAAGLVGVSMMFAGCGGGGDTGYYPIANIAINGGTQELSATKNIGYTAAGADLFKLTLPTTAGYAATIQPFASDSFKYEEDKISVPTGSPLPTALAGGVNDGPADGKVDLTWSTSTSDKIVTINLIGLNPTAEAALQSNAANAQAKLYTTY